MKELTVQDVMECVFTSENPETGSLPPEEAAWVIFENNTVFFMTPTSDEANGLTFEELGKKACKVLEDFGPAIAGTPLADFEVNGLDAWYPDEYVYMVTYTHSNIFSIYITEKEEDEYTIGLKNRTSREIDAEDLEIQLIRHFNGSVKYY